MSSQGIIGKFSGPSDKDALDRTKLSDDLKSVLRRITKKLDDTCEVEVSDLRREHEECSWDWKKYRASNSRKTALEDWVYYSNAFYNSFNAAFKNLGWPSGIPHFPSRCKLYSAILGNWILNNHLTYYGKVTTIIPHSVIINATHSIARDRIMNVSYNLIRKAGCSVIPPSLPNGGIVKYPYKVQEGYNSRWITLPEVVQEVWGMNFLFLQLSELVEEAEYNEFKRKIARADEGYFSSRMPLIVSASELLYVPENKTPVLEFLVGGEW